ncbi:uncharacterized protein G2W53_003687 [Senna tora]|uniref:Uncharacterized protein n=1 Tax=Senna tora TaxID=362788 RepID=A0A834XAK2_9FABA|nr:uncharacterized protein G2W53_003687 [Senna tora]
MGANWLVHKVRPLDVVLDCGGVLSWRRLFKFFKGVGGK